MNKKLKFALVTWGIFIILLTAIIFPLTKLFNYIELEKGFQMGISFLIGMVLMVVISEIVRKKMK